MMKQTLRRLLALLCTALLLPLPALASQLVTSFYPIWVFTLNLTEGIPDLTVVNLADASAGCLHDYQLKYSDRAALAEADAFLINGAGMEAFLPLITEALPDLPVIDASAGVPLIAMSGMLEIGEAEEGAEENAHLWMDPSRAVLMVRNLAAGLQSLFPEHRDAIQTNLEAYTARLEALRASMQEALSDVAGRQVLIFHEALPYFAEACGLIPAVIVNKEPEETLSASQVQSVILAVKQLDTLPLLLRSSEEDPSVGIIISETGAADCVLDPFTAGPDDVLPAPDAYETVMLQNVQALKDAFAALP